MRKSERDIPLVPFREFEKLAPRIFAASKQESDKQLAAFQSENARRRASKKNGKTE
jgi:hypothetical protein